MSDAIAQLKLGNFTNFADLSVDFSPKINIIIGENGTGKTHLLKAAYALCSGGAVFKHKPNATKRELEAALTKKILRLFTPIEDRLANIRRRGVPGNAQLGGKFALERELTASFHSNSKTVAIKNEINLGAYRAEPIFIPTKEVLSLVRGMAHEATDRRTVELIFDDGYLDLAAYLRRAADGDINLAIDDQPRVGTAIVELTQLIGGRYNWDSGDFRFQYGSYEERASPKRTSGAQAKMYQDSVVTRFVPSKRRPFASSMTAEGFKKVGMLHRLLSNGTLVPGTSGPLFWDEPESNLNPKLMKLLVQTLLELSRNGQQIIIATHDYVLLKWFNLLIDKGKGDHVSFHSLSRPEEGGDVEITSSEDYALISDTAVSDAFAELYDADVKRALG